MKKKLEGGYWCPQANAFQETKIKILNKPHYRKTQ